MSTVLRVAAVTFLVLAAASPAVAQPPAQTASEPLPMGVPYIYQPGNKYWYVPVVPVNYPYPFAAAVPVYGRYSWDYTGVYSGGFGWYQSPLAAAPYWSYGYPAWYTYPKPVGRVWYGF